MRKTRSVKLEPVHPGEILLEEFLLPGGISAARLAEAIHVPPNRITRIVAGKSGVTADTAMRLARALRTTPQFWLNLQQRYELDCVEDADSDIKTIRPVRGFQTAA